MLWEHEPQESVSTAFSSSPKLSQVFNLYNSIETRSRCSINISESVEVNNAFVVELCQDSIFRKAFY